MDIMICAATTFGFESSFNDQYHRYLSNLQTININKL